MTESTGYVASLQEFVRAKPSVVVAQLKQFLPDADESQHRAWRDCIAVLQGAFSAIIASDASLGASGSVALEYTLPLESRRVDVVVLLGGAVVVLEFKGALHLKRADFDQAFGYVRDLRFYHAACANQIVSGLLVHTRAAGDSPGPGEVPAVAGANLAAHLLKHHRRDLPTVSSTAFVDEDAYQPLPTLVKAARELFESGTLTRIHRAAASTEPALATCRRIIQGAASEKRRKLILVSGVPGAGKTLVGLQLAHAREIDELAVSRKNGERPIGSAV